VTGEEPTHGRAFWAGLVAGWAIMAFGLLSLFERSAATRPTNFALLFLGAVVVHDLVFTPAVLAFGAVLGPRLPRAVRGLVLGAAAVSALLLVASVPVIGGFGRQSDNPSLLPRDGIVGILLVLAVVWAVTAAICVRAWRRRAREAGARSEASQAGR
jgi:hypothetical protein